MYIGVTNETVIHYRDKYLPGIGTVPSPGRGERVVFHGYKCEACGATYRFDAPAEEPFFCACNALVSLQPHTASE